MAPPALADDPVLADRDLARLVRLVYERSGITLHGGKRALIVARLRKRLQAMGLASFSEYVTHVERGAEEEVVELLDAISTNHTYFFREEEHFRFLAGAPLDAWRRRGGSEPLRVWSAACSSGEEPYTIAMTLADAGVGDRFDILASDLSTRVLRAASKGIYKLAAAEALPPAILRRHFERGRGAQDGLVRIAPALRARVRFHRVNLLDPAGVGTRFDVIFCRNVMIYFDRAVQQRVVSMLERHLRPNGYLFVAHAESLNGVSHGLRWVAPAVYQSAGRG